MGLGYSLCSSKGWRGLFWWCFSRQTATVLPMGAIWEKRIGPLLRRSTGLRRKPKSAHQCAPPTQPSRGNLYSGDQHPGVPHQLGRHQQHLA